MPEVSRETRAGKESKRYKQTIESIHHARDAGVQKRGQVKVARMVVVFMTRLVALFQLCIVYIHKYIISIIISH